ncbi:MAG: class I SAM-dependent methyltransferase [Bacteroidota bacterium]
MKYTFLKIHNCNMCDNLTNSHTVLGKRLNQSQGKNPKSKTGITTTVAQCSNCGLIYSNPQPIPNNIQDHYGVLPESYWTEEYFKTDSNYFINEIDQLQLIKPWQPGQKALDIGAGLGKCMIALEGRKYDVYGFEPSTQFYEKAIQRMGINKEKLRLSTIEEISYQKDTFDFITFGAVLEHLYNPDVCLKKAFSWLKKDGIIHIEVPSSNWVIGKIVNLYYKLIGTDYVTNLSPMHSPFHLYEFSLQSFKENAKINNYEIACYTYYPCQTFMPKFLDIPLKLYMKKTNTGMQLAVWLRKK